MHAMIQPAPGAALVSKSGLSEAAPAEYLRLSDTGSMSWVHDPLAATAFPSMRDATRMAMRLPASLRAYGLRRDVEVTLNRLH
jgi:hypothetical protein